MKNQLLQYKKIEIDTTGMLQKAIEKKPLQVPLLDKKDDIGKSINCFLSGKTGKFGKYISVQNALVYRTIVTSRRQSTMEVEQNIIAVRLESGLLLGSSSILPLIGRNVSFGRESLNRGVTDVQTRISQVLPMLPFSVFQETGLSISKTKIIDQGPEETVTREVSNPKYDYQNPEKYPKTIDETVHFTGSKLFEVDGIQFLFDIDRVEIGHKIFNPFLAKIPTNFSTIQDAYETLKPDEVKQAEKLGLKVRRQGEWFLIPSDVSPDHPEATDKILKETKRNEYTTFRLQAGRNRPNNAAYGFKIGPDSYISGKLEHSGREHRAIMLAGWYKVVPNTAIESFQISGDID